jgi:7,8-dihydropterin-6-yl-methyl-4-(beta-D-ribofuranosyl)aminobenzene 5'-phosphate synthase
MTSCGHRGIVNSVRGAINVSGISKVHAILGGFHLIPMHCTGAPFYEAAQREMPGRVLLSSTGTRYTFGT